MEQGAAGQTRHAHERQAHEPAPNSSGSEAQVHQPVLGSSGRVLATHAGGDCSVWVESTPDQSPILSPIHWIISAQSVPQLHSEKIVKSGAGREAGFGKSWRK